VTERPRRPISLSPQTFLIHSHHAPYHFHRCPIASSQEEDAEEIPRLASMAAVKRLKSAPLFIWAKQWMPPHATSVHVK
jgi:hypothetical protein